MNVWQLYTWWDEAVFRARVLATQTGVRHRVRRVGLANRSVWWLVEEVGA